MTNLTDGLTARTKDCGYVSIGLTILAIQQANVRRRELRHALRLSLDELQSHLPAPVDGLFGASRKAAVAAADQLRGLVRVAA